MEVYGRSSIEHHVLDKHDEFVTLKNLVKTNDVISTGGSIVSGVAVRGKDTSY